MRALLALLLLAAPLAAADFPVVYVRAPRNPAVAPLLPEVVHATLMESGFDLVRLDPSGAQTVLYDCDATCSVTDPSVSLNGQHIYFGVMHNPTTRYLQRIPVNGCSIYSMPATGGTATPLLLAADGYTDGLAPGPALPVKPCHLAPQELPGGRLAFTSTLWGQDPPKCCPGLNTPSMQLFVREASGEVQAIAPMTIGSALHPILLTTGELMFSSLESQGHRDSRIWALWSIYPDGRNWAPLVSGFEEFTAFHFQAQRSSGAIDVAAYYNLNNWGHGTLVEIPLPRPVPAFHSASARPCLPQNHTPPCFSLAFSPVGASVITPFTHPTDRPAECPGGPGSTCSPAQRVGKVTHPAAYPDNRLLLTWSPGPVTKNIQPNQPWPDDGIYLLSGVATSPADLELVVNDPAYNEHMARAIVPYATIYGQATVELPWLPQTSPYLHPGSPYGLVGSASVRVVHSESKPGAGYVAFGGLDPFNTTENLQGLDGQNWVTQGSDTSLYAESDVAAMRIVLLEPNRLASPNLRHFANERHRVLAGDGPCGDFPIESDGSFLVRVPADTPFTFQKISTACESLTMAQTWHQVRPGEVRVDCGGCHYHSHQPVPWAGTLASQRPPSIPTGVRNITWLNRIADLVSRIDGTLRGVALGMLGPDAAFQCIADDRLGTCSPSWLPDGSWRQTNRSAFGNAYRSRRSLLWWEALGERRDGHTNADHPDTGNGGDLDYLNEIDFVPPLAATERRDLAAWIDLGMPYGEPAWDLDTARPVVHVEEPRPGEYEDVPRLLYGVADANSGIASITVSASWSVAGRAAGADLHDLAQSVGVGVWEIELDGGECPAGACAQSLTVEALDNDGNPRRVERRFTRRPRATASTPTATLLPPTPVATGTPQPTATPTVTPTSTSPATATPACQWVAVNQTSPTSVTVTWVCE